MPFTPLLANATAITASDFQSVLEVIQAQISVQSVVGVLGVAVGASVGLVFMWWGVRKLIAQLMKAFRNGKM